MEIIGKVVEKVHVPAGVSKKTGKAYGDFHKIYFAPTSPIDKPDEVSVSAENFDLFEIGSRYQLVIDIFVSGGRAIISSKSAPIAL